MKKLTIIVIVLLLTGCGEPAYVGPVMHTETGGKYFCTFETEDVFQEYMMEQSYE